MADNVQQWSIEKVLTCLKHIVYPEILPIFSKRELDEMNYQEIFYGEKEIIDFLKLIYEKSKGELNIYGDIDDMISNIKKVDQIPEFIVLSSYEEAKMSRNCCILNNCYGYTDKYDKYKYHARSAIWINTVKYIANNMISYDKGEIVEVFYLHWLTAFLNKVLRGLEGTFDLIPTDSHMPLSTEFDYFFESDHNFATPERTVTMKSFSELKKYFDQKEERIFNQALGKVKSQEIKRDQDDFRYRLCIITSLIENTKKIFDKYTDLLTPFSKLTTPPSTPREPVIRLIYGTSFVMFLVKEVKDAIEIILKNRIAKFEFLGIQLSCIDMKLESTEERRLGIVHAIGFDVLQKQKAKFNIEFEDFIVLQDEYNLDSRSIAFPIMSAYGTHCIPALDAFDNIIYYLAVILKVFQRPNHQNVFEFIETIVKELFVSKTVIYLIEIWKIDEIIDEARRKFSNYPTEPEYKVSSQEFYNENDVFREFLGLTKNLEIDKKQFLLKAKEIRDAMFETKEPVTIKNIYHGYSQIVRHFLQEKYEKINRFIENQTELSHFEVDVLFEDEPKAEPEKPGNKEFAGFKKGFLNKRAASSKKQEPKQQENIPSCSSENRELKKLQQLQEELEKSKKSKAQCEEELKQQLSSVTIGFQEQLQKVQEDLEKSQGAKTRLEEELKTLEQNYLKEIRSFKEEQKKADSEIMFLKGGLEREKAKNIDLRDEHKTVERNCEELEQEVKSLMLENEKLQADNSKNTEFQQNIKGHSKNLENEHCDLVDIAWSRLHRLSFNNPELNNLKEVKIDVRKMEDCVHEHREKVKKEFQKLKK